MNPCKDQWKPGSRDGGGRSSRCEEWDVGHFEGAERPTCETFAEMTVETLGLSDSEMLTATRDIKRISWD